MSDLYKYFRIEAAELTSGLTQGLLDLGKHAPTQQTTGVLLRLAHTLKGAARVVKLVEIADQAHSFEELLSPFRDSTEPVPQQVLTAALQIVDTIRNQMQGIGSPVDIKATEQKDTAASANVVDVTKTVRADLTEMDALLGGLGEAHAHLGVLRENAAFVERICTLTDTVAAELAMLGNRADVHNEPELSSTKVLAAVGELQRTASMLERRTNNGIDQIEREFRQVREVAEQLRLVPSSTLFTELEKAVRDVADAQSKNVVFSGKGGRIRLDAHVVSIAQAALHQIVRNSVVHGIESVAERRAAGKPVQGTVTLEVTRRGSRVAFICHDDGRGIDLDTVRSRARARGWTSDQLASLDDKKILTELLLQNGFSTSESITELSGRGIGLDVVRDAAVRLGGEIAVTTTAGVGTTFELIAPLSLTALEALAVEVDGETSTIPLDAIRQTLRVGSKAIASDPNGDSLSVDDEIIPFLPLPVAMADGAIPARNERNWSAVILDTESGAAAIGVDRLVGTPTIAIRPLPRLIPQTAVVSGSWIDAEGNAQLVLDPDGLVRAALRTRTRLPDSEMQVLPILVVDDSLTTRMLEQTILESAGYQVELASSAEEALIRMSTSRYALVLVDVEMPGIDGFGFIEQVKADPQQRETPCILVTSRASPEDLRRGEEVGAYAYIAKGEFDQQQLLTRIHEIVGRS